jgi:voltage-gated potassium channel
MKRGMHENAAPQSRSRRRRGARARPVRLQIAQEPKIGRYLEAVLTQTHFLRFVSLLVILWLIFGAGIYAAEREAIGSPIDTYGKALYWGIAAFSTAGIADTPHSSVARFLGGIWIVVGSTIFFGIIIATVTSYFMRPMQSPANQIIDTIEYNLEHLEDLSMDELELLKKTTDALIAHTERLKERHAESDDPKGT